VPRLDQPPPHHPQELCNLLYGYGALRHHQPQLLDSVARCAARRLSEFSDQDLALTLWAYGAVRHCPGEPALFYAACSTLLARRRRLLPMQVVMALQAFAKAGFQPPPAFMSEFASHIVEHLPAFRPSDLCHVLWAYARMGYCDTALVEAVVGRLTALLAAPPGETPALPKEIVDSAAWAAQLVGFWPGALIEAAEARGIYVCAAAAAGAARRAAAALRRQRLRPAKAEGGGAEGSSRNGYIPGVAAAAGAGETSGGRGGGSNSQAPATVSGPELGASAQEWQRLQPAAGLQPRPPLPPQQQDGLTPAAAVLPRLARAARPVPVPLSMHRLQQRAQVAQHRSRQQQHQQQHEPPTRHKRRAPQQHHYQQVDVQQQAEVCGRRRQQQQQQQQTEAHRGQQRHGDEWGAAGLPPWLPDADALHLLESADFGGDAPPPAPQAPNLEPLSASRR
jgi:hypothetical protein